METKKKQFIAEHLTILKTQYKNISQKINTDYEDYLHNYILKIKELESSSSKNNSTKIFIETPYRNNQLVDALLNHCNQNTQLCIGFNITAENETIATFLAKLKKEAFVFSYFRNNELRLGRIIYIESEAQTKTFEFQNNIIDSQLEYNRKDDIVLSAVASNHIEEVTGTTKQGKPKVKNKRIRFKHLKQCKDYLFEGNVSSSIVTSMMW